MPIEDGRDLVFLTGSGGFLGSHILRELLAAGLCVRALRHKVRADDVGPGTLNISPRVPGPMSSVPTSPDDGVEFVDGDMLRVGDFARSLDGCRYVVHTAALYSFAPRDRARVRRVNVEGTVGLLEAARLAGVERVIVTSSSATVGAAQDGRTRTEEDYAHEDRHSVYHQSKIDQERAAFSGRVPVVALLPTAPVGPGDGRPTPTGRLVLDFARGKIFAKPPAGGINVVPVEDVARAHVTALRLGRAGERYLLGGENLHFDDLWQLLSEVTGVPAPRTRIPYAVALGIAQIDELYSNLRGSEPRVPIEGVRMSREFMFVESGKAQRELGFRAGDVRSALERAVHWYRTHGYCN